MSYIHSDMTMRAVIRINSPVAPLRCMETCCICMTVGQAAGL